MWVGFLLEKNKKGSFAQEGHEAGTTRKCGHEDLNQLLGSQEVPKQRHSGYLGSKSCSEDGPLSENEHRRRCCRDFRLHTCPYCAALLLGWVQLQKTKVTHPWGQAHSLHSHTFQSHGAEPVTLFLNYWVDGKLSCNGKTIHLNPKYCLFYS